MAGWMIDEEAIIEQSQQSQAKDKPGGIWGWLSNNASTVETVIENVPEWYCIIQPKKCPKQPENGGGGSGNNNTSKGGSQMWIGIALALVAVIVIIVLIRR